MHPNDPNISPNVFLCAPKLLFFDLSRGIIVSLEVLCCYCRRCVVFATLAAARLLLAVAVAFLSFADFYAACFADFCLYVSLLFIYCEFLCCK